MIVHMIIRSQGNLSDKASVTESYDYNIHEKDKIMDFNS